MPSQTGGNAVSDRDESHIGRIAMRDRCASERRTYLAGDDEQVDVAGEVHGEEESDEASRHRQAAVAVEGDGGGVRAPPSLPAAPAAPTAPTAPPARRILGGRQLTQQLAVSPTDVHDVLDVLHPSNTITWFRVTACLLQDDDDEGEKWQLDQLTWTVRVEFRVSVNI